MIFYFLRSSVKPAEHGAVTLRGLNDTTTSDGEIFTKQDTYIVDGVETDSDDVLLAYALEQVGEGAPIKIESVARPITRLRSARLTAPASATSSYTISGYQQPAMNTVITPVFKTKRYIDVQVTGNEHGTIVPSAWVSYEGEEIHISYNVEEGYIVQNIRVNGAPLTSEMFFMPNEDVVITGDCVPFEGGITKFTLLGQNGIIDQIAGTIDVTVPRSIYLTNALPFIDYYGDYIVPSENTRVDFSNAETTPVLYTVHYGDNQTKEYLVTVHQTKYTQRIHDFVLNGVHGRIDQANRKITVIIPTSVDVSNMAPDDISYSAEQITPDIDAARDFTIPQHYTLTTTGMTPVQYTVYVQSALPNDAYITDFVVSGYSGDIDEINATITLNVPKLVVFDNIAPSLVNYVGRSISPTKTASVNLEDNPTYTVTSVSGATRGYEIIVNHIGDSEAHIDTFKLAGYTADINQTSKVITVTLPTRTNVTGIAPDELTYTGKSIYPRVDDVKDYSDETNPVTYTVIAPDNTEVTYTVRIKYTDNPPVDPPDPPDPPTPPTVQPPVDPPSSRNDEALLLRYGVFGYEATIDQNAKLVTLVFPSGVDAVNEKPTLFVVSDGATSNPTKEEYHNYHNDFTYTITSEDGKHSNTYLVHSIFEKDLSDEAKIIKFRIDDHEGTIDQENGIIKVTLPGDEYTPWDITEKVPDITWVGKTITPPEEEPQNFNNVVTYTVTAENPNVTKSYDVIVTIEDKDTEDPWYYIYTDYPAHGRIDSTVNKAHEGDPVTVWLTVDTGYQADSFIVDNVEQLPKTEVTFSMPAHDVTATAEFSKIPVYYNIVIAETLNGTISSTHKRATEGTSVTAYVTPNTDCIFTSFTVDGREVYPETTDTFSMPAHDVYLDAKFEHLPEDKPKYKIILEDDPHGDIDSSVPEAYEGEEVKIWVTPDPGYKPETFIVDGDEELPKTEVVITMPPHDVTASIEFTEILYKLIPNDPEHGEIITSVPEAPEGADVWIEVIPDSGYRPVTFTVDGEEKLPSYRVEFKMPPHDVTANVDFTEILYHIIIDQNEHGKVISTHEWASEDEKVTVTLVPDDGYEPKRFDVDKSNKLPAHEY